MCFDTTEKHCEKRGENSATIIYFYEGNTQTQAHTRLTSCDGCLRSRVIATVPWPTSSPTRHCWRHVDVIADVMYASGAQTITDERGQRGEERFGRGEGRERGERLRRNSRQADSALSLLSFNCCWSCNSAQRYYSECLALHRTVSDTVQRTLYTVNRKKRDILFLIITLVSLDRFL